MKEVTRKEYMELLIQVSKEGTHTTYKQDETTLRWYIKESDTLLAIKDWDHQENIFKYYIV